MNLDSMDPKLTAYALGELSHDEAASIEKAVAQSAEAQAWVAQVEELAAALRTEFRADLVERKPLNIMPLPIARSFSSADSWSSVAVAALLAVASLVAAVVLFGTTEKNSLARMRFAKEPPDVQVEFETEAVDIDAGTLTGQGDRFVSAADNPIASFPVQVGKASYLNVQRTIASGSLPPRDSVRIEELINYFTYDDPPPEPDRPFSIKTEIAACPWRPEHRLLRIAVKASEDGHNAVVGRNVTAQVEFNPARVTSYRLVGYDQALSGGGTGEIHSGDAVTLLYEVVPSGALSDTAEAAIVKVTYQQPRRTDSEIAEESVTDEGHDFASASPDFKFAAAVAEFAMFLRNSSVESSETLGAIAELANNGLGPDRDGRRAEFIQLIRQTQLLTRG